jgi:hypothetical protein
LSGNAETMVRLWLFALLTATAHGADVAPDVSMTITSPIRDRIYNTRGLRPGVSLNIYPNGGPISNALRERFDEYELCVDFDTQRKYLSCKTLGSSDDLSSVDLRTMPDGYHLFAAFLRPVEGKSGLLTESELSSASVTIPYYSGPLDEATQGQPEWVISLHYSHDAHVAALHFGEPVYVLELERLVERRYFTGVPTSHEEKEFITQAWKEASQLVSEATGINHFDVGVFNSVFTQYGGIWEPPFNDALEMCVGAFSATR